MQHICLISGVTRGLGFHLAKVYRQAGFHVVGLARDREKLAAMQKAGILADFLVCDLGSPSALDTAIQEMETRYSRLDVLIHNAAIQNTADIAGKGDYAGLIHREMQVNFLSPVKLTSAWLPLLAQAQGRVIVISSLLQLGPKRAAPGYCASKAALSNWVQNLRVQLQELKIGVTEVVPGLIRTEMTEQAAQKAVPPEQLAPLIYSNAHRDLIILPGARLAWRVHRFFPDLIKAKLLA
ncbi:MAG: SDR family NAD(P)-dependent oxidoreductase [Acidobacteria bacterium]|nr:SDR family NAD(P)-dependent oxidoreductase [Acidobacteriota bacterium]